MAAKKRKTSDQDESKQSGTAASILSSTAVAEVSFPRGGAGVLTPLERREIAIQAANDLFSEKPKSDEAEGPAKKKRKADKKKDKGTAVNVATKEKKKKKSNSIADLSFKRLTVGSVLFGCISQIHDLEMFVSLPGQLRGVVAITEISDQFTKAVEQVANQQSFENDDMEESQNAELPRLQQYFRLGQYVCCKVINMVNQDEKGNSVKRIELTLRPDAVNNAIMKRDVTTGVILSASIASVEDHGYILNFGIEDLTGFCKHSDAKQYIEKYNNRQPLVPGQIIQCSVLQNAGNKRTVNVTFNRDAVAKSIAKEPWSNYTSVPAGLLVNGVVSEILSNGLRVTFMGLYDAFIEMVHVPVKLNLEEEYKLNQKVKCRILYRVIDAENIIVGASMLPHILNLTSPLPSEDQYVGHVYPFGTTLEEVTVTKIKPRGGVHVSIAGVEGISGFVHISNLSDEAKKESIEADGPFQVGSKHRARVLGYNPIDAILLLSTKAKILSEKYLRVQDVPIGEIIEGTVKNFKENGMNVAISSSINGFVPTVHLADAALTHPELKYKVGAKVKGRVLSIDPVKNRLMLTLKQSLVHSEWPIIKDYENIEEGMTTHGVIFSIKSFGAFIRFYNNVTALCPASEMTETQVPDLSKVFRVGQSVKAYVKTVDPQQQKLIVSLTNFKKEKREKRQERKKQEEQEANKKQTAEKKGGALTEVRTIDTLEEGYIGEGTVTKVNRAHGLIVKVGTGVTGRVHRTDISDVFVDNPTEKFKKGMKVRYAIVRLDKKRKQVDLSLRKSRTDPDQVNDDETDVAPEVKSIDELSEGQVLLGYVDNVADSGVFVTVGRNVTVRIKIAHLSDEFVKEWKGLYKVGQLVKLKVLQVDTGSKRAEGTLKRSMVEGVKPKKNKSKKQQDASDDEDQVMEDADAMETDDEEEEESDEEEDVTMMDILSEDEDEDKDDADENDPAAPDADDEDKLAPLPVSDGFDWTGQTAVQDEEQQQGSESEDESDEDEDVDKKKKKKKEIVEDKTAELSTSAPQSIADFERLIVGSPNSSYIWINYMAYQLQLSEIDKAREIGERALSIISFREEQEKMNVWVAMLNLENTYGSDESLEQVFKRACTYCEPKKVYLQLLNIYERSGKEEKALDLWKRTLKRFSQSSKVWTLCASFYIKHNKADEARELMTRCTHVLPKHKHIKTIVKFAQLEFRHGEVERGRTIFESLISDHPKRIDIWNIYLDMEITAGDQDVTRRLFERMTSMKLSSKKMKFVFKKWLQYEKEHGGEDDIERVKEKAMEFVNK